MMRLDHHHWPHANRAGQRFVAAVAMVASLGCLAGCQQPRRSFRLPDDCLPVRYEAATTHSSCLVASVAMSANYLLGSRKFSEQQIRIDLNRLGRGETRVGDVKAYLQQTPERLYLVTLCGRLDATPPEGLRYWLEQRGYPVICVVNRDPRSDPAFNHAVVVIGISANQQSGSADIIHYLDPSSADQLHSESAADFETLWTAGEYAMMVVCRQPS